MDLSTQVLWSPGMSLETLEQLVITVAYKFYRENKTVTAAALGISARTMTNKLEQYQAREQQRLENERIRKKADQEFLDRCRGKVPKVQVEQNAHVESTAKDSSQLAVSMPKREEIQSVLPDQVTNFSSKRNRA